MRRALEKDHFYLWAVKGLWLFLTSGGGLQKGGRKKKGFIENEKIGQLIQFEIYFQEYIFSLDDVNILKIFLAFWPISS